MRAKFTSFVENALAKVAVGADCEAITEQTFRWLISVLIAS